MCINFIKKKGDIYLMIEGKKKKEEKIKIK